MFSEKEKSQKTNGKKQGKREKRKINGGRSCRFCKCLIINRLRLCFFFSSKFALSRGSFSPVNTKTIKKVNENLKFLRMFGTLSKSKCLLTTQFR
jgi:hypothetical protein